MKAKEKPIEKSADLIDMEEAIGLLKTTRQTFYRWLRSGKFKGMKVGRQWRFYREDIERFLKGEEPRIEVSGSLKPLAAALGQRLAEAGKPLKPAEGTPTVEQVVNLMIKAAIALRASDLHLEMQAVADGDSPRGALRFRIDGVLQVAAEFEGGLLRPLIERWKVMGAANVLETRVPQDCRIKLSLDGQLMDIRACFIPATLGEALTARFLDPKRGPLTLDRMRFAPRDRQAVDRFLALPWGLMVVSGPTGSGKTTALYACLQQCVRPEIKVMSVEDPVEYILPGVIQMQVRAADGLTYSAALRSIMRSDPDVVMIGELRDKESMVMAQQMALTGHLVMTVMHTQNAAQVLTRMVEAGSDPFNVAGSVKLIVGQRLARSLCKACSVESRPSPEELKRAKELAEAGGLGWEALPKTFRQAKGCAECRQTGYRGRTVIAEALEVTPAIVTALHQGASAGELQAVAVKQGMTTLAADGIRRAAAGETTLDEIFRMLPG